MATTLSPEHLDALAALASGIIPPDARDAGAAAVQAGPRLAQRITAGINAPLYLRGLETAIQLAHETCNAPVDKLAPAQLHALLVSLRDRLPAFFKQLRMDVCALYLADPAVWQRIGFPGPSTDSGGYPDFDQPQAAARQHPLFRNK
jgi:hypothetical protein